MLLSPRTSVRLRFLASLAALLCASLALLPSARAQGTRLWTQSQIEDFEHGTPEGVALESNGQLRLGPSLSTVLTTPSTFVWSVAVGTDGTAYVGTAEPATVLRIGPDGKPFTLFKSNDLAVQALRVTPDGQLLAATIPSGKIFQLNPNATTTQDDSSAKVYFDLAKAEEAASPQAAGAGNPGSALPATQTQTQTQGDKPTARPHYIWDMLQDAKGILYVATGVPGVIYRVDPRSPTEVFFKSDEANIRTLAWDTKGNLIAGTDGTGLVYRISPDGKGYVLFEAPRREITSVVVTRDGAIYAACVGDKNHNPLPPLPVQGIGSASITIVTPESLQATHPSSSVPEGSEIDVLAENQAPRKLWEDKNAIVYALALRPDGLLALSGNRGRVFRIASDGSYADIAHLDAEQALSFAATSDGLLIGTGNTGKLVRMGTAAGTHAYSSDVFDAGVMARFGRVEVAPGSTGYQLFTRTGNIEQPVRGWSDWEPLHDGAVASPAGRFLQWKAVLSSGGVLGSVGVNYLPLNIAPVVDEVVVVPDARITPASDSAGQPQNVSISFGSSNSNPATTTFDANAGSSIQAVKDRSAIAVRWTAHDDNGDDLTYSLYLRGDGETVWRLLKKNITDKAYSFEADQIPDGGYMVKIVASDSPSHSPADALTGFKISPRFMIDTTPPVIHDLQAAAAPVHCEGSACTAPFTVTFSAADATSPIARAEYSLDAGPWQYLEPIGKLSDATTERYELPLTLDAPSGKLAEHLITVRVYDRYDNAAVAKTVIAAASTMRPER
jgi:hypothetical protein